MWFSILNVKIAQGTQVRTLRFSHFSYEKGVDESL